MWHWDRLISAYCLQHSTSAPYWYFIILSCLCISRTRDWVITQNAFSATRRDTNIYLDLKDRGLSCQDPQVGRGAGPCVWCLRGASVYRYRRYFLKQCLYIVFLFPKLPAFYGAGNFIIEFTRQSQWIQSRDSWIRCTHYTSHSCETNVLFL